jgi:hypothetical protein
MYEDLNASSSLVVALYIAAPNFLAKIIKPTERRLMSIAACASTSLAIDSRNQKI